MKDYGIVCFSVGGWWLYILYIYTHAYVYILIHMYIYIEHATSIVGSLRDSIKCSGFFLTVQDLGFAAWELLGLFALLWFKLLQVLKLEGFRILLGV